MPRGIKNTYSHKILYMSIHDNYLCNSPKETTQSLPTDKKCGISTTQWIFSLKKKNGVLIHAIKWKNPEDLLSERRQKFTKCCGSIYIWNVQNRQMLKDKIDSWLPECGKLGRQVDCLQIPAFLLKSCSEIWQYICTVV